MAFPVIKVDSTNGAASDTACSGAGPSTALTGTAGATDGAGTTVTLDSGTDLTNVATDGSHAIYFADTTAGHRRFAKITAKAGSGGATPTVTVAEALTISLSGKSWAIGGVRATVGGAVSALLFDNNSASGDAMPGWAVEMQSGHTETLSATLSTGRRIGDTTSGMITLRGTGATRPVLTWSANVNLMSVGGMWRYEYFKVQCSNGTKTSAVAFDTRYNFTGSALTNIAVFKDIIFGDATNKILGLWTRTGGMVPVLILIDCELHHTSGIGIARDFMCGLTLINCWVHDCGLTAAIQGPDASANTRGITLIDCLIENNTGIGVDLSASLSNGPSMVLIKNCTIHGNTSDGIKMSAQASNQVGAIIVGNNITKNGGWGINGLAVGDRLMGVEDYNNFGNASDSTNNTSGTVTGSTIGAHDLTTAPAYTNASGHDYSVGAALKGAGYPDSTRNIGANQSATRSYVDIGVAQRQESATGGLLINPGLRGGLA